MRVLVDGYWWFDGPPSGRLVLRELVSAWATKFPDDQIILAVPGNSNGDDLSRSAGLEIVHTRLRSHPLINLVELPAIARMKRDVDAILTQNFSALSRRSVVYVHDYIFKTSPEWFTPLERAYFSIIAPMARNSALALTSSSTEAARISKHSPRIKILPTGLAVAPSLLERNPEEHPELVPGRFILSVGRLNARKNLNRAIQGALRSEMISSTFPMVVVGEESGKSERLSPEIDAAVRNGSVRFVGFVSDAQLNWLYRECALFCYLSLDEGYGLPPVEALRLGAKVLVSDIPVFRETLVDSATYVDPRNVDAIASAVEHALSTRSEPSLSPAALLDWEDVAGNVRQAVTTYVIRRG